MESYAFDWMPDPVWIANVQKVSSYYADRPHLKFGPTKLNKAFAVIGELCSRMSVTQSELMETYELTMDDILTILSNVTMAIQGKDKVRLPAEGGWYTATPNPYMYFVSPGFAVAWNAAKTP
jgi:hypothetical protein